MKLTQNPKYSLENPNVIVLKICRTIILLDANDVKRAVGLTELKGSFDSIRFFNDQQLCVIRHGNTTVEGFSFKQIVTD